MATNKVESPNLLAVALQVLLVHAKFPHLLKDSKNPVLKGFSEKPDFYEKFVKEVMVNVKAVDGEPYNEQRLKDKNSRIPQDHYRQILECFKRVSGVYNPRHYQELGQIISTIQSPFTQMASLGLGPRGLISLSSGHNNRLNNDQEVRPGEPETTDREGGGLLTTVMVQHYLLPSTCNHYPEQYYIGAGYWEGMPNLWGWNEKGKVNVIEEQIPLEDLVKDSYGYLGLKLEDQDGLIFINGVEHGVRRNVSDVLKYNPYEEFLSKSVEDFKPILITKDFVIDDDLIFPEGVLYGMPCCRYHVSVPHPTWFQRLISRFKREASSSKENYKFLSYRGQKDAINDAHRAAEVEAEQKYKEKLKADRASANAERLKAELDAASRDRAATLKDIEKKKSLAHDMKGRANYIISRTLPPVREYLQEQSDLLNLLDLNGRNLEKIRNYAMKDISILELIGIGEEEHFKDNYDSEISDDKRDGLLRTSFEMVEIEERDQLLQDIFNRFMLNSEDSKIRNSFLDPLICCLPESRNKDSINKFPDSIGRYISVTKKGKELAEMAIGIMKSHGEEPLERIAVRDFFDGVIDDVRGINHEMNVEIINEVCDDIYVMVGRMDYRIITTNLTDNAVKASEGGKVVIKATYEDDFTRLDIMQSGSMSEEKAEELSLNMVESSRLSEGGTGSGVDDSHNLTKGYQGDLSFEGFGEHGGLTQQWLYTDGPNI